MAFLKQQKTGEQAFPATIRDNLPDCLSKYDFAILNLTKMKLVWFVKKHTFNEYFTNQNQRKTRTIVRQSLPVIRNKYTKVQRGNLQLLIIVYN